MGGGGVFMGEEEEEGWRIDQQYAENTTHHGFVFRLLEVLREKVKLDHNLLDLIEVSRHLLLLVGVCLCLVVSQLLLKLLSSAKYKITISCKYNIQKSF